jgi:hypothetical protein
MHLARVSVREFADLEVDHDQAAEAAVEEEQIDAVPSVANASLMASSGVMASAGFGFWPVRSMAALFRDSAVRS